MYDADARPETYLRSYAEEFDSVEIDSTFYGTPDRSRVARWKASVPADFRFALKMTREVTHDRKLFASGALVREFFANVGVLGETLGAVLVQLPPAFGPDDRAALDAFVALLPRDVRCALEFRDARFYAPPILDEILEMCEAGGIALVLADGPFVPLDAALDLLARPTADFAYLRWLGDRDAVTRFDRVVFDRTSRIARWAEAIARAPQLRTVYGYANNHYAGHAPVTVRSLYAALGIEHRVPPRIRQTSLF